MKPFLKWAGGKSRLVSTICSHMPCGKGKFIEPFLGSASVFLGIPSAYSEYILSDINADIISLYNILMRTGEEFIVHTETAWNEIPENLPGYLAVRSEFNSLKPGDMRRAVLFIWLNKHAFNGICRYNSKGGFNVPYNNLSNVSCPAQAMRGFHKLCAERKPVFTTGDFSTAIRKADWGDTVYCDPPYLPLGDTAGFTSYAKEGFSGKDHIRLAEEAVAAHGRGATVIISNHDVPAARTLYKGARFIPLQVKRMVAANPSERVHVSEILAVWEQP